MIKTALELPAPSEKERASSARLVDELRRRHPSGALTFAEFMAAALYTPDLGYYAGEGALFGASGDFVTAPELTPVFSYCLANQAVQVLHAIPGGDIAEFGGGSGVMASDILSRLDALDCLPRHYFIIEISAALRQRQRALIAKRLPQLVARVQWVDALPERFEGLVLGNEILDALPVHRLRVNRRLDTVEEMFVSLSNEGPQWQSQPLRDPLLITLIERHYRETLDTLADGYHFELCPALAEWMHGLAAHLQRGVVILIDYGQARAQLFHPQRVSGTLACHYRHRTHGDALWLPGQQDITAHVDFTRVAELASAAGLTVCGYTHQAGFLLGCGIENFLPPHSLAARDLNTLNDAKKLLLPDEMGEAFNVIGLSKEFDLPLRGFALFDRRARL